LSHLHVSQHLRVEGRLHPRVRRHLERLGDVGDTLGAPVYLVGGPVRDLLLGRQLLDIDIAIEGDAGAFARALAAPGADIAAHPEFNSATLSCPDGARIDILGARSETYAHPGALPTVCPADITEDLRRRDFTVNAMALALSGPDRWGLIDPHCGYKHLRAGRLAVLHARSFIDDPTRILRAARFAGRMCLRPEPSTDQWLREAIAGGALSTVSPERLLTELRYLLVEPTAAEALRLLADWGALEPLGLPDPRRRTDVLRALLTARRRLSVRGTDALLPATLAALPEPHRVADWVSTWPLTAQERVDAQQAAAMVLEAPAALFSTGVKSSTLYLVLESVAPAGLMAAWAAHGGPVRANVERYARRLAHVRSDICGDDLIRAGFKAGPAFKSALRAALAAKLDCGADAARQLQAALGTLRASARPGRSGGRRE